MKELLVILGMILLASGIFVQVTGPERSLLSEGQRVLSSFRMQEETGGTAP